MDAKRKGVISAGTWALDTIKRVDCWPQEEHLAQIINTDMQGGGSGHNLAVDMRKLDSAMLVEAIGLVGNDTDGEFLLAKASDAGIKTTQLHQSELERTSFTDVISDPAGKRTFFHFSGTSNLLSPEHFDFGSCKGRLLHLGLLGLHETMDSQWQDFENGWVAVLADAKTHGIATNLELCSIAPERIQAIATPCLPYLDTLIINEFELSALSGIDVVGDNGAIVTDQCVVAAKSLFNKGSMSLVVVHHPAAAIAVTVDDEVFIKPSFAVHPSWVESSVGAGDAFAAGMLYGIHENWNYDASLKLAHAAAAASLRAATTVGSVETVAECLAFAARAHEEKIDDDSAHL